MLNPSTADAEEDDNTIRRAIGFTRNLTPAGGLAVVNLFAYRATNPKKLLEVDDPVGPANVATIRQRLADTPIVIAAWGAWWRQQPHPPRRIPIDQLAAAAGHRLQCLGQTARGEPRHPLYVRAATHLEPYDGPGR